MVDSVLRVTATQVLFESGTGERTVLPGTELGTDPHLTIIKHMKSVFNQRKVQFVLAFKAPKNHFFTIMVSVCKNVFFREAGVYIVHFDQCPIS